LASLPTVAAFKRFSFLPFVDVPISVDQVANAEKEIVGGRGGQERGAYDFEAMEKL